MGNGCSDTWVTHLTLFGFFLEEPDVSWKECDHVSERLEFATLASADGANISALCRRFGVSRKTGYKWLNRFRKTGEAGLIDQPKTPHSFREPTPDEMEASVLAVRDEHPAWGGRKIRKRLLNLGHISVPAASTITEILRRHNRLTAEASQAATPLGRFERPKPNDLWQIDFKGEFRMSNSRNCYPLTVLDDHSRFCLGLVACSGTTIDETRVAMTAIFQRYGVPVALYADNGPPFGAMHSPGRHTRLTVWMMRQGIHVIHGTPYHPQGRGKEERFHRTLNCELIQDKHFDDLDHSQSRFDPWRHMYNHERPHEALKLEVPATRYVASQREFSQRTRPFEYSDACEVRRTNRQGQFKFRGKSWKAGGAFGRESIGLRPTSEDGIWEVCFTQFSIGLLDLKSSSERLLPSPKNHQAK